MFGMVDQPHGEAGCLSMEMNKMEFQLWEDRPPAMFVLESRCFAKRTKEQVKEEYHDMEIGEVRQLKNKDHWIVRSR